MASGGTAVEPPDGETPACAEADIEGYCSSTNASDTDVQSPKGRSVRLVGREGGPLQMRWMRSKSKSEIPGGVQGLLGGESGVGTAELPGGALDQHSTAAPGSTMADDEEEFMEPPSMCAQPGGSLPQEVSHARRVLFSGVGTSPSANYTSHLAGIMDADGTAMDLHLHAHQERKAREEAEVSAATSATPVITCVSSERWHWCFKQAGTYFAGLKSSGLGCM